LSPLLYPLGFPTVAHVIQLSRFKVLNLLLEQLGVTQSETERGPERKGVKGVNTRELIRARKT